MASEMHLHLTAILLRRGSAIDRASSVLTLLNLLISLAPVFAIAIDPLVSLAAVLILILGLAEKYWAQRVAIDAELFSVLATKGNDLNSTIQQLDTALNELGFTPATTQPRSLAERSHGALRLLRWQAICLGGQSMLVLAACIAMLWLSLYS